MMNNENWSLHGKSSGSIQFKKIMAHIINKYIDITHLEGHERKWQDERIHPILSELYSPIDFISKSLLHLDA